MYLHIERRRHARKWSSLKGKMKWTRIKQESLAGVDFGIFSVIGRE